MHYSPSLRIREGVREVSSWRKERKNMYEPVRVIEKKGLQFLL